MKRAFLNILIFGIVATFSLSCERETEDNSASVFYINPPLFSNPNGTKTYWNDDGLWWNQDGTDYINVNGYTGSNFKLQRTGEGGEGTSGWKAIAALGHNSSIGKINDNFYVCYVGGSDADIPTFDTTNKVFSGVDISGIVPLVGVSKTPVVTLKPCCAVLRLHFSSDLKEELRTLGDFGTIHIDFLKDIPLPGGTYDLDPENACVQGYNPPSPPENFTEFEVEYNDIDANGYAYVVVPMHVGQYQSVVLIENNNDEEHPAIIHMESRGSVDINKGYVYCIEVDRVRVNK